MFGNLLSESTLTQIVAQENIPTFGLVLSI